MRAAARERDSFNRRGGTRALRVPAKNAAQQTSIAHQPCYIFRFAENRPPCRACHRGNGSALPSFSRASKISQTRMPPCRSRNRFSDSAPSSPFFKRSDSAPDHAQPISGTRFATPARFFSPSPRPVSSSPLRASLARQDRRFTSIAILVIVIGIRANAALFSIFSQLILRPVSLPQSSSHVAIWSVNNNNLNFTPRRLAASAIRKWLRPRSRSPRRDRPARDRTGIVGSLIALFCARNIRPWSAAARRRFLRVGSTARRTLSSFPTFGKP